MQGFLPPPYAHAYYQHRQHQEYLIFYLRSLNTFCCQTYRVAHSQTSCQIKILIGELPWLLFLCQISSGTFFPSFLSYLLQGLDVGGSAHYNKPRSF
jgi:hypothetical protein